MVDVETLKEAIDDVAFGITSQLVDNHVEPSDALVTVTDAALEHVACLEGPTDEEVEIAMGAILDFIGEPQIKRTGVYRQMARAALVAVAEARRQK